jgi:hypothetical protein
VRTRVFMIGYVVQMANAFDNRGEPPHQDRDKAGDSPQNEGWRRCLGDNMRKLNCIGRSCRGSSRKHPRQEAIT